ncbi:alpha/beta hydrolase [Microbulbifer sp. OS29]|uniref:Proline iminopeptidase n=1 Tax=Microbulbifer okhotskensis TaxID=2926617 RepID=A0A9X2EMR9_9GAMM|nr:alpha/beta hydrolase [Microbulbifer okhotskensis]MCO1335152.1 alpha/beta hydrolase [Microbulbifer okhotskensis]
MRNLYTLFLSVMAILSTYSLNSPHATATSIANEEPYTFTTWSKQSAEGYSGFFEVTEDRSIKESRKIPIHYVRFPAIGEKTAPPIIYLAGGPGGSGIMTVNFRFDMFMALRRYGDVIALDQRGTGLSNDLPNCESQQTVPPLKAISDSEYIRYHQEALKECLTIWQERNVNLSAYNTKENALDLDDLRKHLGAKEIVLWGTSYGSHLALAAVKEIESSIDKLILSSAEGLEQTIKLPARTEEYWDRLQQAINQQAAARAAYPDIKALIRRVHAKLDKQPMKIKITQHDSHELDYLLQRRDMQQIASAFIADPKSTAHLLEFYRTLDLGEAPAFDKVPKRYFPDGFLHPGVAISLRPMATAMDIASGIDNQRKLEVKEQSKTALLKDYLNFSFHYDGLAPELDLGKDFRKKLISDIPVLLLSGTLDGRTYLESQHEAISGFSNTTKVTVENAGHNLFMASSEIQDTINLFMEGKPIEKTTIMVELPDMAPKKY